MYTGQLHTHTAVFSGNGFYEGDSYIELAAERACVDNQEGRYE